MGWSTAAPSLPAGASWSGWTDGAQKKPSYFMYRVRSRIARGAEKTVYVHVQLQAMCYDYDRAPYYIKIKGQVSVGNTSSYVNSPEYTASVSYGTTVWTTVKDIYYTDTAASGTKVYARAYNAAGGYTNANAHAAPA